MSERDILKLRLMAAFIGGFFNDSEEFIAHRYSNTYFIFKTCENELDVKCKILEWLSRSASKGQPYASDWRNKKFNEFMLDGINKFLHTDFDENDIDCIYQYLGNCIDHEKTVRFVESGYNFSVLVDDKEK